MKKLSLGKITDIYIDMVHKTHDDMLNVIKDIKTEYQQNVSEEKIKLLMTICNGENLDFDVMKTKYLKPKEIGIIPVEKDLTSSDENILDKIEINGKQYYYEAKEKSIVYDMNSKPVGNYKNGAVIIL
jgi:hypothetical protein